MAVLLRANAQRAARIADLKPLVRPAVSVAAIAFVGLITAAALIVMLKSVARDPRKQRAKQ